VSAIQFEIIPAPKNLREDVECFRLGKYTTSAELAVKVCPNGFPGILFQHSYKDQSAVKNIVTRSGRVVYPPISFIHGQVTELSIMNFSGPFTTIQAVLKPHALKTLFGIDASTLTNGSVDLNRLSAGDLNMQLIEAPADRDRVALLAGFLAAKLKSGYSRDTLIEESLVLIQQNISSITLKYLLERLGLSERQFEKRFRQTVGISPKLYIRIKRVNEAMRLMDTGSYARLTDVAHALNFYDQSHFIRDIRVFSGIAPKNISQKVNEFRGDRVGFSYLYA
jgi:AraC-like DNA-binding protein